MCAGAAALVPVVGALCFTGKMLSKTAGVLKNKVKGTAFEKIVQDIADGWERTFLMALSWWIQVPSPALTESTSKFCARNTQTNEVTCPGGSFNSTLQRIGDYTFYLQILGLIGSLIFMAIRMGLANRGLVEETEDLWKTLGRAMFAVTLLGTFIILGMQFSDRLSSWLLKEAIGDNDPGQLIKNLFKFDVLAGGLGYTVMFVVLLMGVIGSLIQLVMLLMRQAMLIVVVSAIPLAAASSGTGPGSSAYQKMIAWTIAFLLFKPVGALVYMIAFTAVRTKSNDPQLILLGIILLGMSVFVLSALMRLIAPAVGTMGGGGSAFLGGMAGAAFTKAAGKAAGGGGGGGGGGNTPLQGRGGSNGPPPAPPSPPSGTGKHAAMSAGPKAASAAGSAGGASTAASAAGGPVGAAVGAGLQASSKVKDATAGAINSEADGGQVNPTGSSSAAAPSTSVPSLTSGSGEHRMAS